MRRIARKKVERTCFLALILIAHGLVLWPYRDPERPAAAVTTQRPLLVTFLTEAHSPEGDLPAIPNVHSFRLNQPAVPSVPVSISADVQSSSAISVPTTRAPDWDAERSSAAAAVLQKSAAPSPRAFEHSFPAPKDKAQPGVFGTNENHRAGKVEDGEVYWVSDNCYLEFDRSLPPQHVAGEFHLKTATCKPPPTGGGPRMFESLAPTYIQPKPPDDHSGATNAEGRADK